ncbi:hypothetical protein A3K63_00320 [Candidatus Micrarchaeota archaeon RBG_16_49_10]|nr:MAG: hypothetical protein A3K63_00320 [Candidatus Micrarchaeota archaeon RBG_16_49_10]
MAPILANDVTLVLPDSAIAVYAGEQNIIEIPIKNSGLQSDTVSISIWPNNWVDLKTYWVTLGPGETKKVSLFVELPETTEEGVKVYTITSKSLETDSTSSLPLYLNVKRRTDIILTEIKLNKQTLLPGEVLSIQSVVANLDRYNLLEVTVTTDILKDGKLIKKSETVLKLEPKSTGTSTVFFDIENVYEAGNYAVEASIRDSLNKIVDEDETSFEIKNHIKISKEVTGEWGLFYFKKTIRIENQGNVRNSNLTFTDSIPKYMVYFFYPSTEPASHEIKDKNAYYYWEITNLNPNDSTAITYRLNFFALLVALLLACILLALLVKYLRRPIMVKNHRGFFSGDKEVSISLHIKNRGKKPIKNIFAKDFVPSVVKVIGGFDTLKPKIRKREDGIDLLWKIEKIRPGEEVILSYKIQPSIEIIGDLELPKAKMMHESRLGKRRVSISKSIIIKGKIK